MVDNKNIQLLQKKYFEKTVGIFNFNTLSDSEVDNLVEELLSSLPMDKHLYKYRSFKSSFFKETISNIENGELFLPAVTKLNDKIDCTFNYQNLRTEDEIKNFIKSNALVFYLNNLLSTLNKESPNNLKIKINILKQLVRGTPIETIALSLKQNASILSKLMYIQNIVKEAKCFVSSDRYITEIIKKYRNLGEYIREQTHIFSLCETCTQDSMWAYYSDNNNGYCIEYDLNKIKSLDYPTKRKLLSFYKVDYSGYRQPIDSFDLFEVALDRTNMEKNYAINSQIIKSFITKSTSWEHEKEWRIILEGNSNIINADLVSAVIIDGDYIGSKRAMELIKTTKSKGLPIKVRHLDRKTNTFKIIDFKE